MIYPRLWNRHEAGVLDCTWAPFNIMTEALKRPTCVGGAGRILVIRIIRQPASSVFWGANSPQIIRAPQLHPPSKVLLQVTRYVGPESTHQSLNPTRGRVFTCYEVAVRGMHFSAHEPLRRER